MPAFIKKNYTVRHNNGLPPIHPGEILREEFLKPLFPPNGSPLGFDVHLVAERTGIHALHLKSLLHERVRLTVEDAFRLARYFGGSVDMWLGMQESFDVKTFERSALFQAVKAVKPHPKRKGVLIPVGGAR